MLLDEGVSQGVGCNIFNFAAPITGEGNALIPSVTRTSLCLYTAFHSINIAYEDRGCTVNAYNALFIMLLTFFPICSPFLFGSLVKFWSCHDLCLITLGILLELVTSFTFSSDFYSLGRFSQWITVYLYQNHNGYSVTNILHRQVWSNRLQRNTSALLSCETTTAISVRCSTCLSSSGALLDILKAMAHPTAFNRTAALEF